MPSHFRRFRILNDTTDAQNKDVTKATFSFAPPVVFPVVGLGTYVPTLATQFFADDESDPGEVPGEQITVNLEITGGLKVSNWALTVAAGVAIEAVDIKVISKGPGWKARATVAGVNYAFKEFNEDFA